MSILLVILKVRLEFKACNEYTRIISSQRAMDNDRIGFGIRAVCGLIYKIAHVLYVVIILVSPYTEIPFECFLQMCHFLNKFTIFPYMNCPRKYIHSVTEEEFMSIMAEPFIY